MKNYKSIAPSSSTYSSILNDGPSSFIYRELIPRNGPNNTNIYDIINNIPTIPKGKPN